MHHAGRIATALLALLISVQLALWLPAYVEWPLYADHDVFLTLAQSWHQGLLPYKDTRLNNFPGALYLSYVLGVLGGWGNPRFVRGAEAALVLSYGAMIVCWARRRFGALWPGLYGVLTLLGFYLFLDYHLAGQRDTYAPMLALTSLMLLDGWKGRWATVASGIAMAMALCFRPHAVVFVPGALAMLLARRDLAVRSITEWGLAAGGATVAWLFPLIHAGILGDFIGSVRSVAYGGEYSNRSGESTLAHMFDPLKSVRVLVCLAAFALALRDRTWRPWLAVLAGGMLYIPISPALKPYLTQPMGLVAAFLVIPGAWAMARWRPWGALAAAVVLLVVIRIWPPFAKPTPANGIPTGYISNVGGFSNEVYQEDYPWPDLRATLDYIRADQPSGRRVANLLSRVPALCSSTGRLSAFPFESVAWVKIVRPSETSIIRETLEKAGDWLVVLSPAEFGSRWMKDSEQALRRNYAPAARFGGIEVWKLKGEEKKGARSGLGVE